MKLIHRSTKLESPSIGENITRRLTRGLSLSMSRFSVDTTGAESEDEEKEKRISAIVPHKAIVTDNHRARTR